MSFSSLIKAELGLGTSQFKAGLREASSSAEGFKKTLERGGAGGVFSRFFSTAAILQGFSAALNHAQQLRDQAAELGQPVDNATASVARYADAWDSLKKGIAAAAVTSLGFFTQTGEWLGLQGARVAGLLKGQSVAETDRIIRISEEAGANADRLSDPRAMADAKARGAKALEEAERRNEKAASEAVKARRDLAQVEAELATARIEAAKAASDAEGRIAIVALEVADAQAAVNEAKVGTIERAKAELNLMQRQQELAAAQVAREKELSAEKAKQLSAEAELAKRREEAAARLAQAVAAQRAAAVAYATALSDQSAATFEEVLAGRRGSPDDQRRATEIARLRAAARSERDAGNTQLVGGQLVAVADTLSTRANQLQTGITPLNSTERDPLGQLQETLARSEAHLASIERALEVVAMD